MATIAVAHDLNGNGENTKMRKTAGFTLIELLVVLAIVAILTRIAIASYQDSVNKGRRSEATTALLQGAQQLERYYSANGKYQSAASTLAPVFQTQVPATGTAYYTIAVSSTPTALSDTTYTLQATRAGVMSTDKCGDFQINQAGAHTLATGTNTYALDQCWRR
jgi:type IV pilus assembly protein PilE